MLALSDMNAFSLNRIHLIITLSTSNSRQRVWFNCIWLFSLSMEQEKYSFWIMFSPKKRRRPGPCVTYRRVNLWLKYDRNFLSASSRPVAKMSSTILMRTISAVPFSSLWKNNWGIAHDWTKPRAHMAESDFSCHFSFELTSPYAAASSSYNSSPLRHSLGGIP